MTDTSSGLSYSVEGGDRGSSGFDLSPASRSLDQHSAGGVDLPNYWRAVIGDQYTPAVLRNVKHMHPTTVKEVFDRHVGTDVADVIAGLIFKLQIADNRLEFFIQEYQKTADPSRASSTSTLSQDGWRDIDSAPRDGRLILASNADFEDDVCAVFYDDENEICPWAVVDGPNYMFRRFTHWRPLPPPPGQEGSEPADGAPMRQEGLAVTEPNPDPPTPPPSQGGAHTWVPSTYGHGETMCSRCGITNREAAVLGELNECAALSQKGETK